MPYEVITTDQLKYSRLIANRDNRAKDRWQNCFSWYPGKQNIEYGRIGEIYCESRHRYGDEVFLKYAFTRRLNKKHTFTNEDDSKKTLAVQVDDDRFDKIMDNQNCKVPPTTNGEYGRCRPTRMHYC